MHSGLPIISKTSKLKAIKAICRSLILTQGILWSPSSRSAETIGEFKISDLRLRTTLFSEKNGTSNFELGDSGLQMSWKKDDYFSAQVEVGPSRDRILPAFYAANETNGIDFVTAYAQFQEYYGTFRTGIVPLNMGYEGQLSYSDRVFNRSAFFANRVIGHSDYGASFLTSNKGYYTQLTIHNGELNTASDGRLWASGLWGYTDDRNFRIQISMQTGTVDGTLSSGSSNKIGGVTNGQTARWRTGTLFMNWQSPRWKVATEISGGEVVQNKYIGRYSANLFEIMHDFTEAIGSGLRYEFWDPNGKIKNDSSTLISYVMAFNSRNKTSNMFLQFTKVIEESRQIANDQIRLSWLLTPLAH